MDHVIKFAKDVRTNLFFRVRLLIEKYKRKLIYIDAI